MYSITFSGGAAAREAIRLPYGGFSALMENIAASYTESSGKLNV
jgi:hypothetical protein